MVSLVQDAGPYIPDNSGILRLTSVVKVPQLTMPAPFNQEGALGRLHTGRCGIAPVVLRYLARVNPKPGISNIKNMRPALDNQRSSVKLLFLHR